VGTNHELGPLEMQVLGLFEGDSPTSVAAIHQRLRDSGAELAYTTVLTVISRLHKKGVLVRKREGRRHLYSMAGNASEKTSGIVERIHRALFRTVRLRPITALLDQDDLSTEELRALRRLVDAKLRERRR
jgi:predicted transcriptional regulator